MTASTTTRKRTRIDWSKMKVTHAREMTPEWAQALIATPAVSRALAELLDKEEKRRKALAGELHQDFMEGFAYAPQVLAGLPEERIEVNEDADLLEQEGVTKRETV